MDAGAELLEKNVHVCTRKLRDIVNLLQELQPVFVFVFLRLNNFNDTRKQLTLDSTM